MHSRVTSGCCVAVRPKGELKLLGKSALLSVSLILGAQLSTAQVTNEIKADIAHSFIISIRITAIEADFQYPQMPSSITSMETKQGMAAATEKLTPLPLAIMPVAATGSEHGR